MSVKMGHQQSAHENELIGNYIDVQAKAIAALYPEVRRHLTGEPVHSLRVATRRAQAAFWVLKNCAGKFRFRKLTDELEDLVGTLGEVRALDVAVKDAKKFGIDSAGLESSQEVCRRKLHGRLKRGRLLKMEKHFAKASVILRAKGTVSTTAARAKLREQLAARLKKKNYRPGDYHKVRIKMKKVRYVLESMGKNVDSIRDLQKILGNAHDLQILENMTGEREALAEERKRLNAKALGLIKPAIRVALAELKSSF
jgi:CHAD domain-containing protein